MLPPKFPAFSGFAPFCFSVLPFRLFSDCVSDKRLNFVKRNNTCPSKHADDEQFLVVTGQFFISIF